MRRAAQWERGPSDSIHIPSLQPVITGMPELCRAGLSENWLLKACGHRHWLALAQAHGMEKPDFRDKDDACIYPAFTHIHVADTWFDRVAENQRLDFALTLHRTGRTRFRSEIQVACDEVSIATLIMETTFVRRTVAGSNHGAVRAIVASPCRLMPPAVTPRLPAFSPWDDSQRHAGLILDPSPHEDFNGAGFLYFAAFQAMLDRAEWHWFRQTDPVLTTQERRIAFLGNAELGERTELILRHGDAFHHRIELRRCSDSMIIARAETRRRMAQSRRIDVSTSEIETFTNSTASRISTPTLN